MFKLKVKENEKALLCKDEKFIKLVDTGVYRMCHLFRNYSVERVRIAGNGIDGNIVVKLYRLYPELADRYFNVISQADNERAYIWLDGKFTEMINLGETKLYWKELEINSQELLSADKVTLRCNITMHYKIADGIIYLTKVDNTNEYLHKQLQFAVRKHLGSMDIDTILSMQHTLSDEVLSKLSDECEAK